MTKGALNGLPNVNQRVSLKTAESRLAIPDKEKRAQLEQDSEARDRMAGESPASIQATGCQGLPISFSRQDEVDRKSQPDHNYQVDSPKKDAKAKTTQDLGWTLMTAGFSIVAYFIILGLTNRTIGYRKKSSPL